MIGYAWRRSDLRPAVSAAIKRCEEHGDAWLSWSGGTRLRIAPRGSSLGPEDKYDRLDQFWVIVVFHSHFVLGCYAEKDGGYLNDPHPLEPWKLRNRLQGCCRFTKDKDLRAIVVEAHGGELGRIITDSYARRA